MIKCKAIEILLLPAADCDLRLLQKPFIGLHGHALLRPAGLQSIRQIILRSSHFDGHEGTMKRRKNKAINRFVTSFVFRPSGVHICQLFSPRRRRRCCRRLESESRNAHDGGSYRAVDVMHRH